MPRHHATTVRSMAPSLKEMSGAHHLPIACARWIQSTDSHCIPRISTLYLPTVLMPVMLPVPLEFHDCSCIISLMCFTRFFHSIAHDLIVFTHFGTFSFLSWCHLCLWCNSIWDRILRRCWTETNCLDAPTQKWERASSSDKWARIASRMNRNGGRTCLSTTNVTLTAVALNPCLLDERPVSN
jgi:hypothetical protein